MGKVIIFTDSEREVLKRLLTVRLKSYENEYADFFNEKNKRHYANYMTAVRSTIQKITTSDSCDLIKWEKKHCTSVMNGEYRSLPVYQDLSDMVFDPEIYHSIKKKCVVFHRGGIKI